MQENFHDEMMMMTTPIKTEIKNITTQMTMMMMLTTIKIEMHTKNNDRENDDDDDDDLNKLPTRKC